MMPYWLLFLFPASAALSPVKVSEQIRTIAFFLFGFFSVAVIGLRYEVGADWAAYLDYVDMASGVSLLEAMAMHDPGYMAINWVSAELRLGIAGVNLIGGGIFIYGLLNFCKKQQFPWLGLAVAVPYLVIVVGMGYSRQAIALGVIFLALSSWARHDFSKYIGWVIVATAFHKTAIVMMFFVLFMEGRRMEVGRLFAVPFVILVSYVLFQLGFFEAHFDSYIVQGNYESQGGLVRVAMNVVPSVIFLIFYRQFSLFGDRKLLMMMVCLNFISLPLVFGFSTVVDRFSLYLTPVQISVYSRVPLFFKNNLLRLHFVIIIIIAYASILWVWMEFSNNAEFWRPYRWVFQ